MQISQQNDRSNVTSPRPIKKVKNPYGILSGFFVSDDKQHNKSRAEALAAAYEYIIGPKWEKHGN